MYVRLSISAMLIFAVIACGSSESTDQPDEVESVSAISLPGDTFTTESFENAGWKKSKQYDTATVPESTEIWYGFYNQKDIEIRLYPSHDVAVSAGVPSAEESIEGAVKRSKGGKLLDVSGGSFTGYSDYVVAGNAVLLCEFDRTRCDELVSNLK